MTSRTRVITVHEAKTHLSRLVERAASGEEIVIGRAGKPEVKLVPYRASSGPRQPGAWSGRVWMSDDFDVLPDEVLATFETSE
jgi:prevent-host-death family protein